MQFYVKVVGLGEMSDADKCFGRTENVEMS